MLLVFLAACASNPPTGPGPVEREHDPRFHGWWIVEQPFHAAYESTLYEFRPDGELRLGASLPPNCTGHLEANCVTGTVANCTPAPPNDRCESELVCVFGDQWWSKSSRHLVILGECTDGRAREIEIELAADASSNTEFGGAGGTLLVVDGETGWSHNNWEWAFRKCAGDPDDCSQF